MKDYVEIKIASSLNQDEVYNIFSQSLKDMQWRRGDSDVQGLSVSGRGANKPSIKCWIDLRGANIKTLTISFRDKGIADPNREIWKENFIRDFSENILPKIGQVKEIKESD